MSSDKISELNLFPLDEHNQKLINYVHPADWVNPSPQDIYDLVVIGAGTAGLVVAAGAAGLDIGLKIALVEKHLMGGDCLNFGCVPSKCVIRSARIIGEIQKAKELGINVRDVQVDFAAVMTRMRQIRADISHHDSVQRFQNLGIDVFLGTARFVGQNTVVVGEKTLSYKKAVIATGARAVHPQMPGLTTAGFYTNETIFSLTKLPPRLAVIGGGPIGCELAQAFSRLGSQVFLFHNHAHLLNKEDPEAAAIIQNSFLREGIQLILSSQIQQVTVNELGKTLEYSSNGQQASITVDEILVGAGRQPNLSELNLDAVGVAYDALQGIKVNDYLQTTNPKIYAAGDICMNWKFTHAADAAARIVIKNTLFSPFGFGRYKLSNLVMPWVTYTDPEIAHVGMSESQAQAQGWAINTIKIPLSIVDRAIVDGESEGFLKIIHPQGSDQILGATFVATHAGEMISEITTAIVNKIGLSKLATVIHPYPTQAEAIKKAADAYRRTLLTPNSRKLLAFLSKI